jgi:hypothetical protein
MEVQYSMHIQIHDLQSANKTGVNEDYRLLDCEATQLASVLQNVLPPSLG